MPPSRNRFENTPTERNQAWSLRTANAVPIWQAPSQATVVAWFIGPPSQVTLSGGALRGLSGQLPHGTLAQNLAAWIPSWMELAEGL